jgi:hypothetical protein
LLSSLENMRGLHDYGKTEKSEKTALPSFNIGCADSVFSCTTNCDFQLAN